MSLVRWPSIAGRSQALNAERKVLDDAELRRTSVLSNLTVIYGEEAGDFLAYRETHRNYKPYISGCIGFAPPGLLTRRGQSLRDPVVPIHWAGTETADVCSNHLSAAVAGGRTRGCRGCRTIVRTHVVGVLSRGTCRLITKAISLSLKEVYPMTDTAGQLVSKRASHSDGPRTMSEALERTIAVRGNNVAIRTHDNRISWTWNALGRRVEVLAAGFVAVGISHGDKVALLMRNRPEFHLIDLALVRIGAVPFSLYATSSPQQHEYSLQDSAAATVIVDSALINGLPKTLPDLRIVLEGEVTGWKSLNDVEASGSPELLVGLPEIDTDDVATMIYTSGTTGNPKGVLLTHRNLLASAHSTQVTQELEAGTVVVSWLPAAHIGDRIGGYALPVYAGLEIVTVDDPREIIAALPEIRPGYFFAPPRVFEKLRADFGRWRLELTPELESRINDALERSHERVETEQRGDVVPAELLASTDKDRDDLFRPWLRSVGLDNLKVCVVATAPNPKELMGFYHTLGVPMGEAYGATESSGGGTASRFDRIRIGTVGQVSLDMEIRLLDDGEVLLRGPHIMKGYHNLPEQTAATVDPENWLHTGDLGSIDDDGFVTIVGRKKELIISSSGKNISPVAVESALISESDLIAQVCCMGDGRPYNVALVVLDAEYAKRWAEHEGLPSMDLKELSTHKRIQQEVAAAVDKANVRLNRPEQIKKFQVLSDEWLPGGMLTPTSKMRRAVISTEYQQIVESMYA